MNQEVLNALNWRYSVKLFDENKKISENDWDTLEQALILTPSSFGLQHWKFLIVQNKEIRKKLTPLSWNQRQIETCSHLVIMCARRDIDEGYIDNYLKSVAETRGLTLEMLKDYRDMMIGFINAMSQEKRAEWAKKQCYIALGQICSIAAMMKIDACPMEGFDSSGYDEVLNLKDTEYTSTLACPLGYRSADDSFAQYKKVRFSVDEMIKFIN